MLGFYRFGEEADAVGFFELPDRIRSLKQAFVEHRRVCLTCSLANEPWEGCDDGQLLIAKRIAAHAAYELHVKPLMN